MSTPEQLLQRSAEREERLKEEKLRNNKELQLAFDERRAQLDKDLAIAKKNSEEKRLEKKKKIIQEREEQAKELAQLQLQIEANLKEQSALNASRGQQEVEKAKLLLVEKREELERKAKLRREQLEASSEILSNGEKKRQEELGRLREERLQTQKKMNDELLELNQKVHEVRLKNAERLQELDSGKNQEQKKRLMKKEDQMISSVMNTQGLMSSIDLEDAFANFKQKCKSLMRDYDFFNQEYQNKLSSLLANRQRMKNGRSPKDTEMNDLLDALGKFQYSATSFSSEGSTLEDDFNKLIGQVISIIRELSANFRSIEATYDDFKKEENPVAGSGETEKQLVETEPADIGEDLLKIEKYMKELSELIQKFNVIGRSHIHETLAIQMRQNVPSSRDAIGGPPTYDKIKAISDK